MGQFVEGSEWQGWRRIQALAPLPRLLLSGLYVLAAAIWILGCVALSPVLIIVVSAVRRSRRRRERRHSDRLVRTSQAKADLLLSEAMVYAGTDLPTLQEMDPADFEIAVAKILEALGEGAFERIGRAGDHGADLKRTDPATGQLTIVQCKRYTSAVQIGTPALRNFLGSIVHYKAAQGIFVTTSGFSVPAYAFAQQHGIRLIAGGELSRMAVPAERSIALAPPSGS